MSKGKRIPYDQAVQSLAKVTPLLTERGIRHEVCGSIRRQAKTIGDYDLVVNDLSTTYFVLTGLPIPSSKTPRKKIDVILDGIQVNLYQAYQEEWGAMILFLTGNGFFNIQMRAEAKRQGLKLNQYGLWEGEDSIAGRTEELIFQALGLRFIEPTLRSWFPDYNVNHFTRI